MKVEEDQDSIGRVVNSVIINAPRSLDEAVLGKAMLSIPATKRFEIGTGIDKTK